MTHVTKAQGLRMQAHVTGKGDPAILVPGGLTGWISWEPHARRLSRCRKVVRVQPLSVQWGREQQPLPPDYSIELEGQALVATLADLELDEPTDIVGWSFGALISLHYALDNPDRVRTLTLIEPPAFWVLRATGKMDAYAEQVAESLRTFRGDISEDRLEEFLCAVGLCPPGKSPLELPQWPVWLEYRQSLRNSPAVVEHDDDLERVRGFDRPVLLVKGTGSAAFLHRIVDTLVEEFPNARVIELPGGHAPHIAAADSFLEQLAGFQSTAE